MGIGAARDHAAHTMHDKHKHAKRAVKSERTRCRDEKYAGRAGPPDCVEVQAEAETEAQDEVASESVLECGWGCEREESVGEWDIVAGDEDSHNPGSCHPPCTSHTRARCTVS